MIVMNTDLAETNSALRTVARSSAPYSDVELGAHAGAHEVVYPGLGRRMVERFHHWNGAAFGYVLPLMPIQIVPVAPYGHWIGRTGPRDNESARGVIKLQNIRGAGFTEELDEVLLHEALHQYLHIRGENTKHAGAPWRREVTRLSLELFEVEVECAPSHTVKGKRITDPAQYTPRREGVRVLVLNQYCRWPHCLENHA
jgi:hypothetical protein